MTSDVKAMINHTKKQQQTNLLINVNLKSISVMEISFMIWNINDYNISYKFSTEEGSILSSKCEGLND